MVEKLHIYNSLTKKKEIFKPLNPPFIGIYVCGPTVYSDVHLGNMRTFICFDIIYRYLKYLGYKVRYVRNITDVGHLEDDTQQAEDKISKKARLENLEPMEIVQKYSTDFHKLTKIFNMLPPDIEPSATGHIIEQIEMIQTLIEKGLAYTVNGSVYFDVTKYNKKYKYGKLSGLKIEEMMESGRKLAHQDEKRNNIDFSLWKKAHPNHIMRWKSPWGDGFPGWHVECSVMSTKYLGKIFDIHGGGLDLKFPHHECEIAQSVGSYGKDSVRYWMHTNMLTLNGKKMSKSLGNFFLPNELFTGKHTLLDEAYSPMTAKFFMLQSHYSSTLDFSNEALKASKKGYIKLINGLRLIKKMQFLEDGTEENVEAINQVETLIKSCHSSMNDDFNTALTIGHLFNLIKKINSLHTQQLKFSAIGLTTFTNMKTTFIDYVENILGLEEENPSDYKQVVETMINTYKEAKFRKDFIQVDKIRARLKESGIIIQDMKIGVDWAYEG